MLNNTDADGYQPPPCFVDWPEGTFNGETKWTVGHCQNLVNDFQNCKNLTGKFLYLIFFKYRQREVMN